MTVGVPYTATLHTLGVYMPCDETHGPVKPVDGVPTPDTTAAAPAGSTQQSLPETGTLHHVNQGKECMLWSVQTRGMPRGFSLNRGCKASTQP
jgi:hypothetical protein